MLLSAILRILDRYPEQPKVVEKPNAEKFEIEAAPTAENVSGLQKIEAEIAAAAGLLNPVRPHPAGTPPAGPNNLGELIRAVTKFEKSKEERVVDVFE